MRHGWAVFPVKGKIPLTPNGVLDATTDEESLANWPSAATGIGLATGTPSGVWVVDIDSDDAMRSFQAMQKENGDLIRTVASKTGKGYHVFFRMPASGDIRNSASKIADGLDVRGTGGYVVLPPSKHPNGGEYEWAPGRGYLDFTMANTPGWLQNLVTGNKSRSAPVVGDQIGEGGRNAILTSLAGSLRRRGASEAAISAALHVENDTRCVPPLPSSEVDRIASSVARYAPSDVAEPDPVTMELIDGAVLDRMCLEKLKPVSAVATPWPTWNRVCRGAGGGIGLAHGWHVIAAAPSGAGKSLFATNFAAHAVRGGEHVCMISLEMSQIEIMTRFLAMYSRKEVRTLEHGRQFDKDAWADAAQQVQEAAGSLRVNRTPIASLDDIEQVFHRHINDGCTTFITDYLQLAWVRDAESLRHQVTEVSHTVRKLAHEYGVLSLGLSQVNRQTSTGSEMRKEGLMGGSSLENDADQVVMLSRPERKYVGYESHVTLDKNRHGPGVEWDLLLNTHDLTMLEMTETKG